MSLLYGTQPAEFDSAYNLEESVRRLAAATRRHLPDAPFRQAAVGRVSARRVCLERVTPEVRNPCTPRFYGAFEQAGERVRLVGRFAMTRAVKVFVMTWLGLLLLLSLWARLPGGVWTTAVMLVLALATIGGLLLEGKCQAREDPAWLAQVIEGALGAEGRDSPAQGSDG